MRPVRIDIRRRIAGFLLGTVTSLLRLWRSVTSPLHAQGKDGDVVILEPFGMGDVISLEPLARALCQHQLRVHICAKEAWRPIIPDRYVTSWLDSKIPWASYDTSKKYSWRTLRGPEFRESLRSLRSVCRGAVGLDTRGDIRSVFILYLAGCSKVYTFSHYLGSDMPLLRTAARTVRTRTELQRWRLNLTLLEAMGLPADNEIGPPSLEHLRAATPGSTTPTVALVCVAPWPGRAWSPAKWKELVQRISDVGLVPFGLCGPAQLSSARQILGDVLQITECASTEEWANQLCAAAAIVTLNTGPMHLAASLGRPTVVIDGPSVLPLWSPSHPQSEIIEHQDEFDCAPCHQVATSPACRSECLERIGVDEVLSALLKTIEHPSCKDGPTKEQQ